MASAIAFLNKAEVPRGFTGWVIGWTLAQLKASETPPLEMLGPHAVHTRLPPPTSSSGAAANPPPPPHSSSRTFKDLLQGLPAMVLLETWAALRFKALELANTTTAPTSAIMASCVPADPCHGPDGRRLTFSFPQDVPRWLHTEGMVVVLEPANAASLSMDLMLPMLELVGVVAPSRSKMTVDVYARLPKAWERHGASIKAWTIWRLDAAATHARCFAAVTYDRARVPRTASALLTMSPSDPAQPPPRTSPPTNATVFTSTLNPSQRQVADWFSRRSGGGGGGGGGGGSGDGGSGDGSVQCVWGPPGTGKSTTIVAAMQATLSATLAPKTPHAIVASAPSNQAVQTLATRFRAASPSTPCCLIATADKIQASSDPRLRDCFLHGWAEFQAAHLGALAEGLVMADSPLKLAAVCEQFLAAGRTLKTRVPGFHHSVAATWDAFIDGVVDLCSRALASPVGRDARLVACSPLKLIEQKLRTAPAKAIEHEYAVDLSLRRPGGWGAA